MATSSPVKQIAQNASRVKAFSQIGKKIFSKDALKLNPTAIASLLRSAGVNLPKEAVVTADMAQIIISGGAFVNDVEKGASIQSFATPTAAIMQASLDVMEQVGWVDKNSPGAFFIGMATDIAMVVATGGVNVLADLKLVMDIVQGAFMAPDAKGLAFASLGKYLAQRRKNQIDAFSSHFKEYHEGTISTFELMADAAQESPDLFENFFPEAASFFPSDYVLISYSEETSSAFGTSHNTYTASQWVHTLLQNDAQTVQNIIWNNLIKAPLLHFKRLNDSENLNKKISVQNLALLSMLPPYIGVFPSNFDATVMLKKFHLTPDDLNDPALDEYLYSKKSKENTEAPITYNGVEYHTAHQKQIIALNDYEQFLIDADRNGRIDVLLKDQEVSKHLSDWGSPAWIDDFFISNKTQSGQTILSKTVTTDMSTQTQRTVHNYWAALALFEQIKNDRYFQSKIGEIETYSFMGSLDDLKKRHQEICFKVQTRGLNQLAYQNIASYLGVAPNKLKLVKRGENGSPAVFQ